MPFFALISTLVSLVTREDPPLDSCLARGGPSLMVQDAPVLMVGIDEGEVERELVGGGLVCPACRGVLCPWGFARWRVLRGRGGSPFRRRPRRSICRSCRSTHVLLPVLGFLRRRDLAEVIGEALLAKAAGAGHRRIARRLGLPPDTVRGWLRRFAARAGEVREHFTRLAHLLGANLAGVEARASPGGDALEAIGVAARAAADRFGAMPVWWFASAATGGGLLSNTGCPFPLLA